MTIKPVQMADKTHYTRVLKYWRSIETYTLPEMPDLRRSGQKHFTDLKPGDQLPWQDEEFLHSPAGKEWRHTLYFYPVAKETVIKLLESLAPHSQDEFRESQPGNSFHSALVVDQYGQATERTYRRSYFSYGIKILKEGRNPEELNGLMKKAYTDYASRLGVKEKTGSDQAGHEEEDKKPVFAALSWVELEKELDDLWKLTNGRLTPRPHIVCVTEEVTRQAIPDAPFLNSFYLTDLNNLIAHPENLGLPLETYLSIQADEESRCDLLSPGVLLPCLNPRQQSPGRWPSNPESGLYSAQQAALHLAIPKLGRQAGLLGINGPPGTGKTTLLREIVADTVVSRARRLLKADVSRLFSARSNEIAEYARYYTFDKKVFGNDGILVSSNNNAAVENISRELPVRKSIDAETFGDADYFSAVAQNLQTEGRCWGLISAVLGNSTNRNSFSRDFWRDRKFGFDVFLKAQYNSPDKTAEHITRFKQVARELASLFAAYAIFQTAASEHFEVLSRSLHESRGASAEPEKIGKSRLRKLEKLTARLEEEYQIPVHNIPGRDFLNLSAAEMHRLTPYSSAKINGLRSRIFLKSLELHECAILANAKYFRSNLSAFIDMLAGKHTDHLDEGVRAVLWGSFFFCVPLVSATLASIEKLFTGMGRASIGWLLLDEAGQASPQSACGAIWRSEKCILLGDTLQIPPVVTIPEGLGELLRSQYGLKESCWSPLRHSAQFLADRVTRTGTYIDRGGGEVWTGIPLRAHRRCEEPMFSIANTIAYNGQMVKLTPDLESGIFLPNSCWIDVRGMVLLKGHIISEEINAMQEMLALLLSGGYRDEIFIISPFRSIGDHCREQFAPRKDLRVRSGTIHTFQGKEADIVLLVLGTDWEHPGARKWASSTPNILNVAITRARKRLYVVGNRQLWAPCNYFDHLAGTLPVRLYKKGEPLQHF
jgi:hypothetical protein